MAPIKTAFLPFIARAVHISIRLLQRRGVGGEGKGGHDLYLELGAWWMSITARELFTYKSDTRLPGEVSALETSALSREEGLKEVKPDRCLPLRSFFFFFFEIFY